MLLYGQARKLPYADTLAHLSFFFREGAFAVQTTMVSAAGVEPARVASLASEASAFTNFATQTYKPRVF